MLNLLCLFEIIPYFWDDKVINDILVDRLFCTNNGKYFFTTVPDCDVVFLVIVLALKQDCSHTDTEIIHHFAKVKTCICSCCHVL